MANLKLLLDSDLMNAFLAEYKLKYVIQDRMILF